MNTIVIGIDESESISYFESLEHAQRYIEPSDIDLWHLYGADGRIIGLTKINVVRDHNERGPNEVVKLVPTEEFGIDSLRCALVEHFFIQDQMGRFKGSVESLKGAPLDELIALLIRTSKPK